jgi:hypothetical protein
MYEMQGPHFGLTNHRLPIARLPCDSPGLLLSANPRDVQLPSLRTAPGSSPKCLWSCLRSAPGVSSEAARWPTDLHDFRLPSPRTASGFLSREPSEVSSEVPLESPPKRPAVQVVSEFLLPPAALVQEVSLTFSRFFFHPQDT